MSRKAILVVEDNVDLRLLFSDELTMAGFTVRQAADGIEALRLLDAAPPDLVVLDLGLPHVSGHDVLFELKQHSHTRHIPVVVVTGADETFDGLEPNCVLRKPVRVADLVRAVQRCLDSSNLF